MRSVCPTLCVALSRVSGVKSARFAFSVSGNNKWQTVMDLTSSGCLLASMIHCDVRGILTALVPSPSYNNNINNNNNNTCLICVVIFSFLRCFILFVSLKPILLIPMAARSKAWVSGRSLAGIAGSNPSRDTYVSCECCVLSGRGLCDGPIHRPEELYWMWCVWVWSWSLDS